MDVQKYFKEHYAEDLSGLQDWVDKVYEDCVGKNFEEVQCMAVRLGSEVRPVSDEELEWIITILPVRMFTVSEALNQLRLKHEFTKLKNRQEKSEASLEADSDGSAKKLKYSEIEAALVAEVFAAVIRRIENEISSARELIMGAKKVWDSRRSAEKSNPIGETSTPGSVGALPEYTGSSRRVIH